MYIAGATSEFAQHPPTTDLDKHEMDKVMNLTAFLEKRGSPREMICADFEGSSKGG